jgi:hypothetical protein
MMKKLISPKLVSISFGILVLCFAIGFYIYAAWNEPQDNPPQGNVEAPLNVSGTAQTKIGNLTIPNLYLNPPGVNEGNIYSANIIQGYNDLLLYGNSAKNAPIYLEGSSVIINNDAGTGNVGIGTTNPANSKLEVNGAIRSLTTPTGDMWASGFIGKDETTGNWWQMHFHGDSMRFYNGSIEKIVCDNSNNCGFGGNYWAQSGSNLYPNNTGWNVSIGATDPAGYTLRVAGTVRGTAFYDENNLAFYLDPNSVSILNDVRSSIFYDRDNTGYYVDPYGSSRLANIYADYIRSYGNLDVDGAIYDGNDGDVNIGESLYVSGTGTFTSSVAIAANQRYYFNGQGGARYFYDDNANNRIGISTTLYMNNQTINGVYQINQNNGNWNLYSNGNAYFAGSVTVGGGIQMGAYQTLYSPGRMHINGEEILYLLNKSGVIVSKAWGGNGNLTVEGKVSAGSFGICIEYYCRAATGGWTGPYYTAFGNFAECGGYDLTGIKFRLYGC